MASMDIEPAAVLAAFPRFLSYVVMGEIMPHMDDPCLIWTGPIDEKDGYGRFSICSNGKWYNVGAHRIPLAFAMGGIKVESKYFACHHCDNPICVNPRHLIWQTHKWNMRNMREKGRAARLHTRRKLNLEKAKLIKYSKNTYMQDAAEFGIARDTVKDIRRGRRWPQA